MPLFEELNLSTVKQDNDIFISARELAWHIVDTMKILSEEAFIDNKRQPFNSEEIHYFSGVMQGMNSVVLLLSQGGVEEELHENINSVEDLLRYMKDDSNE